MGQDSKIAWTHHTFNPWRGCTKVSDGCKFCYADVMSVRNPKVLGVWGPQGTRVIAAESYWKQPPKWNEAAKARGEHYRVFCASLADVFEGPETMPAESWPVVRAARKRLFDVIRVTPNLNWLLLTKRPQNIREAIERAALDCNPGDTCEMLNCWLQGFGSNHHGNAPDGIWLGTSVEDQRAAVERIPHLLKFPAVVRFLSCEPLIGPVGLGLHSVLMGNRGGVGSINGERVSFPGIDWVIVGCESGPHRRPMELNWARCLRDQCAAASVPFFMKQMEIDGEVTDDMEQFPADLRIRKFPK